ncbi:TfoX/Sxy family protein [Stigmatella sp. ncwal1]|uniref:TfoX/Sxy family protein n=1 Tax=Stigmatella ashevillensis TaxID=2995309 RepID=A0ABT5D6E6_9BACT|nr:TfoX/Sxy family protein [Stigmatella ashevillena]MDC0708703.1 TfoX/Sxy family protein [Stigmatella ashevillena]
MDRFVEYTLELLEPLGPVRARAMFGGWGLYSEGVMMGLIISGQLFLKTDELSRPAFEAAGGVPFVYDAGRGRAPITMSYWTPPAEAVDDAYALLPWARRAVEAALRTAAKKEQAVRRASAAKKKPARSRM